MNTDKERKIGIGTNYTFDTLNYGECNINTAYQSFINVTEGDIIYIDIYLVELYNNLI